MVTLQGEYNEVQWMNGTALTTLSIPSSSQKPRFLVHQKSTDEVFGETPRLRIVQQSRESLFHEAAVFVPSAEEDCLFVTSNILHDPEGSKLIKISKLKRKRGQHDWSCEDITTDDIPMGNGGVNMPDGKKILFCSQGSDLIPSSLVSMEVESPHKVEVVLTNFHGRRFNSLNDVIVAKDGSIWFTDPMYGSEQGFRPQPDLPNQLYRYDPQKQSVRAMADGFGRPNGLCFSPDERTLYVTDTDWIHGDGSTDGNRASHIYAFTVSDINGGVFLTQRRLFAMADSGAPDGIKCDTDGRVYSGCGDGVNIWLPNGDLIGKIVVPGGVANFCFGRPGELVLLNETMMWIANISQDVRGALLDGMGISV